MNTEQKDIDITLLGKRYTIKCPDGKAHELQKAALLLDQKMTAVRDHGKMVGIDRIAIITALNLAHESIVYQQQKEHSVQQMVDCIKDLQQKIASAL